MEIKMRKELEEHFNDLKSREGTTLKFDTTFEKFVDEAVCMELQLVEDEMEE